MTSFERLFVSTCGEQRKTDWLAGREGGREGERVRDAGRWWLWWYQVRREYNNPVLGRLRREGKQGKSETG